MISSREGLERSGFERERLPLCVREDSVTGGMETSSLLLLNMLLALFMILLPSLGLGLLSGELFSKAPVILGDPPLSELAILEPNELAEDFIFPIVS